MIGAFVVYGVNQVNYSMWLSAAITMTIVTIIGVGKEMYDKRNGGIFDKWDLIMDELGGIEGIGLGIW